MQTNTNDDEYAYGVSIVVPSPSLVGVEVLV